ncbi:L-rhamnose mutarotase [Jatrophihabitans telluris]|uniref:L-rhamnose mutarotase n=1 Tax=Jatrophihabitans telluris TaxID=2038343 RepID=A0ABY4R3U5_9ACTN|nr:L-rhamnose mutarotase [Jatrophihabitans telluris]UQX89760.1 L-rhamnose mutarotase [Jatrophihabitans telluris]
MKRVASVIGLRPDKQAEYLQLHQAVWPGVQQRLRDSHVTNYSIFLRDGLLFSYFEYVGEDYEADMAAVAADRRTQRWWELTDPCQRALPSAETGQRWVEAVEVFRLDEP